MGQVSTQHALLRTFGEEVSDVQLQRGNDLVKHLEFLPKARHLEDEAGWHLRQLESCSVEGMLQQLLDCRQHQAVVLVQEDLIAVTFLHFTTR